MGLALFAEPEEQSLDTVGDFFWGVLVFCVFLLSPSPCRGLESQHTTASALPVMAKITSSSTILVAGELAGGWTETQLQ